MLNFWRSNKFPFLINLRNVDAFHEFLMYLMCWFRQQTEKKSRHSNINLMGFKSTSSWATSIWFQLKQKENVKIVMGKFREPQWRRREFEWLNKLIEESRVTQRMVVQKWLICIFLVYFYYYAFQSFRFYAYFSIWIMCFWLIAQNGMDRATATGQKSIEPMNCVRCAFVFKTI